MQGGARGLLQQLHSKLTQPLHPVILGDPPCGDPHLQTDTEKCEDCRGACVCWDKETGGIGGTGGGTCTGGIRGTGGGDMYRGNRGGDR